GDCPRAVGDLLARAIGLPLEFPVALRPPRMHFTLRAPVTAVPLHASAQALDSLQTLVTCRAGAVRILPVLLLEVAELTTDAGIVEKVAVLALHGLEISVQRLLCLANLARQSHDRAVGLELRERRFEDLS